ncbi:MAG TPA: phosphoadenylyl-sulfate reductase [Nitrososphaerales archaeon]
MQIKAPAKIDRKLTTTTIQAKQPRLSAEQVAEINKSLEGASAQKILEWSLKELHPKIALASSFGLEDVALIDMMVKINPKARIFSLETGRLHQETYDVMDEIKDRYNIQIEAFFPDAARVEKMVREKGMNLFYHSVENRKLCCGIRKVEPLNRALSQLDGWITGIRKDQTQNRTTANYVEIDTDHGNIIKVNPLLDWSLDQVWVYVKQNKVPYNILHDRGFPSIGCEPCTRAIQPGEDPRAGRWWWEQDNKECGLHVKGGH